MSNPAELQAEFWEERYQSQRTGWDIGEPAPPLVDFLNEPQAPTRGRVFVPGSGRGHDAIYLARRGFEVVGLDFAPSAIEFSQARAAQEGLTERVQFIQQDLFNLPAEFEAAFDLVAEHTCFCAIDPALRPDYVRVIHNILKPGGLMLAVFFAHNRAGGPPFRTSPAEIRQLFGPFFTIRQLAPARRSHPQRANEELFGVLQKAGVS